jgi:hypothetical protein
MLFLQADIICRMIAWLSGQDTIFKQAKLLAREEKHGQPGPVAAKTQ